MATNPFKPHDDENPFARPVSEGNPFARPVSEGTPFATQTEEENPFAQDDQTDDMSYGIRLGKRVWAGFQEQAGGQLTHAGRGLAEDDTPEQRAAREAGDVMGDLQERGPVGRVQTVLSLPSRVFGIIRDEATESTAQAVIPDEAHEPLARHLEEIGSAIYDRGEETREEAGEFGIRRPEGFEPIQATKYYGTQALEALGANILPSMAMGYLTRGRVRSVNNVLEKRGYPLLNENAATQVGGLGTMAVQVYGSEYERNFRETGDHDAASRIAEGRMIAEVVPEILPFGMAMKTIGPVTKAIEKLGGATAAAAQIVGGAITEGASEVLTEAINEAYDVQELGNEFDLEEFKERAFDAFMVGAFMGAGMNIPAAIGEYTKDEGETQAPAQPELGETLDNNPRGGGFDLHSMGLVNKSVEMPDQTASVSIEAEQQPVEFDGDHGIQPPPVPATPDYSTPDNPNPFARLNQVINPTLVEGRDVSQLDFEELETENQFNAWLDHTVKPMQLRLDEMRGDTPKQKAAYKKWMAENKTKERPAGWNVNAAKDNLLTVIAKHGGLETESWASEHGIDITGVRQKGGLNWVAGASQPLFSKYDQAMKPDDLAEWVNQFNPKSFGITDEYLNEDGQVTATTVGNLVQDMLRDPDTFGPAEFFAAQDAQNEIDRVKGEWENEWRDRQERREWKEKFLANDPEILADFEETPTHDKDFYPPEWDAEARTLADWVADAIDMGVDEAAVNEILDTIEDTPGRVRALQPILEERYEQNIDEKIRESFREGDSGSRQAEEGRGTQAEAERDEEVQSEEGNEDLLGEDTSAAQAIADAQREKDAKRNGEGNEDIAPEAGAGDIFAPEGQIEGDLFPGTSLEGENATTPPAQAEETDQAETLPSDVPGYKDDGGNLTEEQARERIKQWKALAAAEGRTGKNAEKVILSLFDRTGQWSQPYEDAGYTVIRLDLDEDGYWPMDINDINAEWLIENGLDDLHGVIAAPPCTDFACSGARWFKIKDENGATDASLELVNQVLRVVEFTKPDFWVMENPVGRLPRLMPHVGKPHIYFQPHDYGDPYTKKTGLWGMFNRDMPKAPVFPSEGSRIHKLRGDVPEQKKARSITPEGFSYAFFMANGSLNPGQLESREWSNDSVFDWINMEKGAFFVAQEYARQQIAQGKKPDYRTIEERGLKPGQLAYLYNQAEKALKNVGGDPFALPIREPANAKTKASQVDEAAHEAATSPENSAPQPTEAQKEAGNYKKGHLSLHGLDLTIENPKGSIREGKDWKVTMRDHYGYIKRTEGNDGDHIDVFLGPNASDESPTVAIVDQRNPEDGAFDEHKVIIGYEPGSARETYFRNYTKDFEKAGVFAGLSELTLDELKTWLNEGDLSKPYDSETFAKENGNEENVSRQEVRAGREQGQNPEGQLPARPGEQSPEGAEREAERGAEEGLTEDGEGEATPPDASNEVEERLRLVIKSLVDDNAKRRASQALLEIREGAFHQAKADLNAAIMDSYRQQPALSDVLQEILDEIDPDVRPETVKNGNIEPENTDERADEKPVGQLDFTGEQPLEGTPAQDVPDAQDVRETARGSQAGSGTDRARDGSADGERLDLPAGMGGGQADLFAAPAGAESGTARERDDDREVPQSTRPDTRPESTDRRELDSQPSASNYVITDADQLGSGGAKTKFKDNVAAIRVLKELESTGRMASPEEQRVLARYVGWGGIPQAFKHPQKGVTKGWEREVDELAGLLTQTELSAAAGSTLNAHFTSPDVINGIYRALDRLGFRGGMILEPSVGTGNFFGLLPTNMRSHSRLVGVELDSLTGRIAKQLYPKATIHAEKGFQEVPFPADTFDVAIGNPPFGNYKVIDHANPEISGWSIHNYFFGRSMKAVKPGGVLAMVISHHLMDGVNSKMRKHLAGQADLLGAIRLPNTAFKQNALTEVVTDIVFLQKREDGAPQSSVEWIKSVPVEIAEGEPIRTNEYFAANPQMMLGTWERSGSMYRSDEPTLAPNTDTSLSDQIESAISFLPERVMASRPAASKRLETPVPEKDVEVDTTAKIYGYFVKGGVVYRRLPDKVSPDGTTSLASEPVELANRKMGERIIAAVSVRDALNKLLSAEINPASTKVLLDARRATLNKEYDVFQRRFGYFHDTANMRAMRDDPDIPRLLALETKYEKAVTPAMSKKTGLEAHKARAGKADIFRKPVALPPVPPDTADTPADGLAISLNETGRVNLERIAELTGKTESDVTDELIESGLIFRDPSEGIVTRDEYLSGNVKRKLAEAQNAAQEDGAYFVNVEALVEVQPEDIDPVDISTSMSSPWIPADTMAEYIKELSGAKSTYRYVPALGHWDGEIQAPGGIKPQAQEFSTDRYPFSRTLSAAITGREIKITNPAPTTENPKRRVLDPEATLEANQKKTDLQEHFSEWIWENRERREKLGRIYNDTYNTQVDRNYDGSFLTFPGMNTSIQLEEHQANGVWRLILDGYGLMDHTVGAGKTFLAIAAIMEKKRMGLVNKPLIVVPNHLVEQWAQDVSFLYPNAKVLAASKKDFQKANRQRFFAKIATGDWDAVIVAHSSFEKIETSPEDMKTHLSRQLRMITEGMLEIEQSEGKKARSFKELQKLQKSIEDKLESVSLGKPKDGFILWRELGVDDLTVDEAHEYKNLFYVTKKTRVAGLGDPKGSKKAFDLYVKTEVTREINGGTRGVTFLTGTPISNSIAEMYTMFRYVAPGLLRERGIELFDGWAAQFAEISADWELDSTAQKYTLKERFRKFTNVPELMGLYKTFADTITLADLKEMKEAQGKRWPTPRIKGLKPENVIVERSVEQDAYMDEIVERAKAVASKKVDPSEDNMLKITNDARLAALDMRLKSDLADDNPGSKSNVAVGRIKGIYDDWSKQKGTQLVFMDLSTPKGGLNARQQEISAMIQRAQAGDESAIAQVEKINPDDILALQSNFSVYDDMRAKLIANGIPANEIAFIHDYNTDLQKAELFAAMRSGKTRILFGSTSKMGAGMNVQNKLVALHHMDAPWRPSDLAQREGRIIRRGNEFFEADPDGFEVEVLRYSTEATYDARMWQIIEGKARFVEQMYAGATGREVDDIAGEAANASEMKAIASGNPLMLEQVQLATAINKLEMSRRAHKKRIHQAQGDLARLEKYLGGPEARYESSMTALRKLIQVRDENPLPEKFSMEIAGRTYDKPSKAGEAITNLVKKYLADKMLDSGTRPVHLFSYRGFEAWTGVDFIGQLVINLRHDGLPDQLLGQWGRKDKFSGEGVLQRAANTMSRLDDRADFHKETMERDLAEIEVKREAANKPFKGEGELKEKKARLQVVMDTLKAEDEKEKQQDSESNVQAPQFDLMDGFSYKPGRNRREKGRITFLTKQLEENLGRYIDQSVETGTFKQVEGPASHRRAAQAVKKAFGRRVVYFQKDKPFPISFNGVALPRDPKTLYVNVDSKNPFTGVIGHELLHSIRQTHPDLYQKLAAISKRRLRSGAFQHFSNKINGLRSDAEGVGLLTDDKMFEEMVANVVGDALLDRGFVNELASDGESFIQRLFNAVLDFLRNLRTKMQRRGMGTSQYFNDVDNLIGEVQTTLKNYRSQTVERADPDDVLNPAFNRDDASDTFRKQIDTLMENKSGEATAALFNVHVGPIDLIWGEEGTPEKNYSDGYGLAKILKKHPEIDPYDLEEIVSSARVTKQAGNRLVLETDTHLAAIRLDWNGEKRKWLLTAYELKTAPEARTIDVDSGTAPETTPPGQEAASLDSTPGARRTDVDSGTDSKTTPSKQAESKNSVDPDTPSFNRSDEQETDRNELTDEQRKFLTRAGMSPDKRALASRVRDYMSMSWKAARQVISDSIQMGLFDKFYGIKRAYRDYLDENVEAQDSGYVAARLSTGAASTMRGILLYGAPEWRDGVISRINNSQGLLDVFEPVQDELEHFLGWMIARRADRLYEEGKENNFSREEIDAGLQLADGSLRGEQRADVYQRVADDFALFKGTVLDLAEGAGLIDGTTRPVWDKADWIPFYRVTQARSGADKGGIKFGKGMGLSHQNSGIRALRGGSEALSDPLGNIIMNFNHLIQASMKNMALMRTVDDLAETDAIEKRGYAFKPAAIPRDQVLQMLLDDGIDQETIDLLDEETGGTIFEGIARLWQLAEPTGKEVVKVMRGGKPEFYSVKDPMLLKSLTNVDIEALGGLFKPLRASKTLLTTMVTAEPSFMARNFTRDALHAWVINEDHFRPGIDSVRGLVKSALEEGGMLDMMFAGGSFQGGYINGTDPDAARKSVRQALRSKGYSNEYVQQHLDSIVDFTAGVWDRWRGVGDAFENANREAVYEAARTAGKSKARAIFEAKDLMDFSMHGSWKAIQMLNDMLPFFNARLQGLYKLGRSGAIPVPGLITKEIAMRGLWIALFSVVLEWLNSDDDDYEALEEWDKDTYWHFFPGTDYHIRVPKPFEVGVLYGTIPQRMYRAMLGNDTTDKFFDRMGAAMMDTLHFDPIPQLMKPAVEVTANKSFFTQRPIESLGDQRKLPRDRYNSSTSDTMVALGPFLEKMGLSPKQGEHLVRGYLGTLGNYALMSADVIVRDIMGRPPIPAPSVRQLPVVGSFVRGSGPAYNTRYGTELYEMHKEISILYGSVQSYMKHGEGEKLEAVYSDEEKAKRLSARKGLASWANQRAKMRKQIDAIYASESMTRKEKAAEIENILRERNRMDAEAYKYFSPLFGRK